jgi:hypothetical protein
MADMGIGAGFGAGGAVQGLQELLQQRMQAAAFAETLRKNLADENLRQQQIDEQAKYRQAAQAALQQEHDVTQAHTIAGGLTPGDSLLQNPGAQNPTLSPVASQLARGGLASNIGVVPPLNASPIPSGAQVPALPSGSDANPPAGDVLRTGPSVSAPLTPPAPGAIGNVTWLGTPQERKSAEQEQKRTAYLRTLDPKSLLGQAAAYTEGTGHPPLAITMKDPAAELQAKEDFAQFAQGLKPEPSDHFTFMPQFDETGKQIGVLRANTKTGEITPAGAQITRPSPGAAQAAQHEQAKREALGSLDQLDQSIDAAASLIGPGSGRYSNLQQMVGSADPRIQALGTKMLLTKMQVDHAATGTVRAGASPQLLARWDNLLANKVTPAGLKAATQAMREILSQGGTSAGTKRVVYDINGNPVK